MRTAVGIFSERADAVHAANQLHGIGFPWEHINLLAPGASEAEVSGVRTTDAEQPGMGPTLGGVVGAAVGISGGAQVGAAMSILVPGLGPVLAVGIIAASLLGVGGAVGGAAVGSALEKSLSEGLPRDELFVYEDALRKGRTIVIALAEDDRQAEAARDLLAQAGAESLDAAREQWWIGLRTAASEQYTATGRDFTTDEADFRRGFEAALSPETRGKPYAAMQDSLRKRYPAVYSSPHREESLRRGYERGKDYDERIRSVPRNS